MSHIITSSHGEIMVNTAGEVLALKLDEPNDLPLNEFLAQAPMLRTTGLTTKASAPSSPVISILYMERFLNM